MVVALENNLILRRAPKGVISQNVYLVQKYEGIE